MAGKPNILIAVPAYRSQIHPLCSVTTFHASRIFAEAKIQANILHLDAADIAKVRNLYATIFLEDATYSHLLFIDNDIGVDPAVFMRMLATDLPLIGCACPKRMDPPEFNFETDLPTVTMTNGIGEVARIGTGILLIRRDVIERLASTGKLRTKQKPHQFKELSGPLYGFFDQQDGQSEDYSFCNRWRTLCGGKVYALFDADVSHASQGIIKGNLFRTLSAKARPPTQSR